MSDHERTGPSKVNKSKINSGKSKRNCLILESTNSESTASSIEKSNSNNQSTGIEGFSSVINLKPHENIWQEETKSIISFNFCKKNKLLQTPTEQSPYECYFRMFFTDSFLDLVVNETNHYAEEIVFSKTNISSRSIIIRWKSFLREEPQKFLGLLFHTENNQDYHLYKTRPVINYFNKNMSDIYYPGGTILKVDVYSGASNK